MNVPTEAAAAEVVLVYLRSVLGGGVVLLYRAHIRPLATLLIVWLYRPAGNNLAIDLSAINPSLKNIKCPE